MINFITFNICFIYLTSLCPSVDTKVHPVEDNLKNTPVMAGLNSSVLVENMVFDTAELRTSELISEEYPSLTSGTFGKSAEFSPANLYLPLSELISYYNFDHQLKK